MSKTLDLYAGGVLMPSPTEVSIDDEIIWSEDSGRTLAGTMVADVVAEKKTLSITWGFMTDSDFEKIKTYMIAGFFPISFCGVSITSYRGTLSHVVAGKFGGEIWHKSASVKVVQQ
jgi:hypothetical protein